MQLSLRLRLREVADSLNILGERGDAMLVNVMFEVANTEEALVWVDENAVGG